MQDVIRIAHKVKIDISEEDILMFYTRKMKHLKLRDIVSDFTAKEPIFDETTLIMNSETQSINKMASQKKQFRNKETV